ncbi:cytochrome P450 [Stachybotrys elegans]|uniref:Cytochrome P450 n=1 Tax=Stachybotrys elegans TaxID=80388 RepID=A0A8K0WJ36_9HYPO|nr:cytochrome P450 [Stachybotrys elegans]
MTWVEFLAGLGATYAFFWAWLQLTQDAREPKAVSTSIPFLSPILSMVYHSMGFYSHMRDLYPRLPIYTLRIPGVRLYVINSANLIPAVQKQWRTLLFPPIQARAAKTAMGASKEALDILCHDMVTDEGFVPKFIKKIYPTLSSGPALNDLNQKATQVLIDTMARFAIQGPAIVNLNEFVTEQIFYATTDGIYGPKNPMRDPDNYSAWLKYHPAIMFMMLDILPLSLFKSSIQGREHLVRSFERYNDEKGYTSGSVFIQRWMDHFQSFGLSKNDIARFHVGGLFALVANTSPTAFWMTYRVFSNPETLEDCRSEVSKAVTKKDDVYTLDSSIIKNSCPILVSTFQEVFRVHGMGNSVRVASEDYMLDNQYLIKRGGLIMIPGRVQHSDRDIWGDSWSEFNHQRFLRTQSTSTKRPNPVAFRGFGGGTSLCPGRHFATAEILLLAAMLIMRFDMHPLSGKWALPSRDKSSQAEAMEQPDEDVKVKLIPRAGGDKEWRIAFSDSAEPHITAEDERNESH